MIKWRRRRIPFTQDPECAEAIAAKYAVDLAMEMQWRKVIIEGDCANVIKALNSTTKLLSVPALIFLYYFCFIYS